MAHNGGRSQLNFWTLEPCGQYPFINVLKSARGWDTNAVTVDPDTLDANGYPLALTAFGTYHAVCGIPGPTDYSGTWVLDWIGNGTLSIGTDITTVSGSLTSSTGTGEYRFTNNQGGGTYNGDNFQVGIQSIGSPRITQIRLYRLDQRPQMLAGEIWNPVFISKLRAGNPGVIRFMDWQNTNVSNQVTWAQKRPLTYITYGGSHWLSSLWAGSTSGTGNAFTVTKSGFSLVDKAQVMFRFNRNGTGLSGYTLNVNTTGPKRMTCMGGSTALAGPSPNDFFATGPSVDFIATATYDLNMDNWAIDGGAFSTGIDRGILDGVPIELCVDLCNLVGAHPWFCIPVYALDPLSDYTTSLATYCRDNLEPGLIPRYETNNEVWNTAFKPTAYATNKALALWGSPAISDDAYVGSDNWYGKAASLVGQAISAVYGADRSRYQMVFGLHTAASDGSVTAVTGFSPGRWNSSLYVSVNGGSPASNWMTHACIANYWWSTYTDTELATESAAFVAGTAPQKAVIVTNYCNSAYGTTGPHAVEGIPQLKTRITTWVAACTARSVILNCYEGGFGADLGGDLLLLQNAAFASSLMGAQYTDVYEYFTTAGGDAPSQYIMAGPGGLSILYPDMYAPQGSPGWDAIVAFNDVPGVTEVPLMLAMRLRLHA